jgi:hypothetical protein
MLLVAILVAVGGCAPAAQPARGPIADQVRTAIEVGSETFDHSTWDELLREGTVDGLVDYEYFRSERGRLDAYLRSFADADLASLERDALMALLINAYNAYTIESILDHWGVSSIREIDGVWTERTHEVGGHEVTLDNLEHNLLRPFFQDPRIHFAVNCASQSCAPLPPWAFTGPELERQLEEWTAAFLNDPKFTRLEDDTLYLSKLLDWYGDDFTNPEFEPRADSLVEFVARYAEGELGEALAERRGQLQIRFLDYDWALNAAE